jgi:hypothetical protein
MARRTVWQIDMGDGTWSVTCMGCASPDPIRTEAPADPNPIPH